jgi:hypothetical protein
MQSAGSGNTPGGKEDLDGGSGAESGGINDRGVKGATGGEPGTKETETKKDTENSGEDKGTGGNGAGITGHKGGNREGGQRGGDRTDSNSEARGRGSDGNDHNDRGKGDGGGNSYGQEDGDDWTCGACTYVKTRREATRRGDEPPELGGVPRPTL